MTTFIIDTYKFIAKLKSKGFTTEQAEGVTEALQDVNLDQLATRADVAESKAEARLEFSKIRTEISEVKYDLAKWMFAGFLTVCIMQIGILAKLL